METCVVALFLGVLALVAAAPAAAQTLRLSPGSLFEAPQSVGLEAMAQAALRRAQEKQSLMPGAQPSPQKPRVVCGMTVIPADPKIDAAIRHPIPDSNGSKFTLQIVVPPSCQR